MKKWFFTICGIAVILLPFMLSAEENGADDSVRVFAVPHEEHGYSGFSTTVLHSQAELDAFLKRHVTNSDIWNDKEGFVSSLTRAGVNWQQEKLVLLRHTETSGSIQVKFHPPMVRDNKVSCSVMISGEMGMGIASMAYYCFAFAVAENVNDMEVSLYRHQGTTSHSLKK